MVKTIAVFLFLTAVTFGQDMAKDETQVWNLEKAYWEYVKRMMWKSIARSGATISLPGRRPVQRLCEKITSPTG
jgi:hypothetical protein